MYDSTQRCSIEIFQSWAVPATVQACLTSVSWYVHSTWYCQPCASSPMDDCWTRQPSSSSWSYQRPLQWAHGRAYVWSEQAVGADLGANSLSWCNLSGRERGRASHQVEGKFHHHLDTKPMLSQRPPRVQTTIPGTQAHHAGAKSRWPRLRDCTYTERSWWQPATSKRLRGNTLKQNAPRPLGASNPVRKEQQHWSLALELQCLVCINWIYNMWTFQLWDLSTLQLFNCCIAGLLIGWKTHIWTRL